jgi:hypothetical protein
VTDALIVLERDGAACGRHERDYSGCIRFLFALLEA